MSAVPIFRGEFLLGAIDEANRRYGLELAFHGSPEPVKELLPMMPTWRKGDRRYPDSDTEVVCADPDLFIPVFMALVPRTGEPFGSRVNGDGSRTFYVSECDRAQFTRSVGYVAVLDARAFTRLELGAPKGWPDPVSRRLPELRRTSGITPDYLVEVTFADFVQLLDGLPGSGIEYRP